MTQAQGSSPKPRPVPAPRAAKPTVPQPTPTLKDKNLIEAESFGRVDENGVVWVKDGESERQIGQFPAEIPASPLEIYARRYLDLVAQVNLFSARMSHLGAKEIDSTIESLREQLKEPPVVGDLARLRQRVEDLATQAEEVKVQVSQARKEAKAQATKQREELVAKAEEIAGQDPARTQWKQSGQQLRDLLEEWKRQQHENPRLDRSVEDALWKRFAQARSKFDKARRQYFNELDASQEEAKRIKEKLILEAEKLSSSTNWADTSRAYRDLMNQWRKAGRASRKEDDRLWQRFHAAQQLFYDARKADNAAQDAEQQQNLEAKEALLAKAEALLPIEDIEQAKASLRPLQDQWDQIGHVPRADINRIESRMRAVEDALREAEEEQWRKSNPEAKARAHGLADQLKNLIEQQEAELAAAEASGDQKKIKQLQDGLQARKAWLAQVESF